MKGLFYFEFDNTTLMPLIRNVDISSTDNGNLRVDPRERESLKWEAKADVFVPVHIDSTAVHTMKTQAGVKEPTEKMTEIKFHWLSVNEPLKTPLIDEGDSVDILLRLTNPEIIKP